MPLDVVTPEIRRYLLGDLDEAAAAALEDRYVADPGLLDQVRAGEDALIDAFLDDRLAPRDRERFEAHYLASPVHRDRVAIARALRSRTAGASHPPGARFYGWMMMAAALVLASLWMVSRGVPTQQAVAPPAPAPSQAAPPVRPAPVTPTSAPPLVPAPTPAPPTPVRSVLALALSPVSTRGGEEATHVRPAGPVDLVLRLEGTANTSDRAYDAELQTVDGRRVWRGRSRAGAPGSGLLTTVRVPADSLAADDYVVVIATPAGAERGRYVLRLRSR